MAPLEPNRMKYRRHGSCHHISSSHQPTPLRRRDRLWGLGLIRIPHPLNRSHALVMRRGVRRGVVLPFAARVRRRKRRTEKLQVPEGWGVVESGKSRVGIAPEGGDIVVVQIGKLVVDIANAGKFTARRHENG